MDRAPEVSLVVSTLGRGAELRRLLESLARQEGVVLEIIVIDQNESAEAVSGAIAGCWPFHVRHEHRRSMRGLSRGRNAGLKLVRSHLVGFPDDDCWYPPEYLRHAVNLVEKHGSDFVCGRPTDKQGRTINGRCEAIEQEITPGNVWTTGIEWLQLFRTETIRGAGGYDEAIGVGASSHWLAGEGDDLVLRLLAAGKRGWYDPTLVGHHAEIRIENPDAALIHKMRGYARGMGHVLRKHRAGQLECAKWLIRPTGGAVLSALRGRFPAARMYANVAIGRAEGMLGRVIG